MGGGEKGRKSLRGRGQGYFSGGVNDKDLISFAAVKGWGRSSLPGAAKVMRSLGELNRNVKPGYGD
jgi:hypothetical protein